MDFEDDFDEDAYLDEWDEASRAAGEFLRDALPEAGGVPPPEPDLSDAASRIRAGMAAREGPYEEIGRANGWYDDPMPDSDADVVVWAAGAILIMENDPGLPSSAEAEIMSLQLGDWIGAVLGLVRGGPGTPATPRALVEHIRTCPDLDGEIPEGDVDLIERAFAHVLPGWEAAGVVDRESRVTRLGVWVLPRMLGLAWGVDFDAP